MKPIFFTILSLLFIGCSTSPVRFVESKEIPKERRAASYEKYVAETPELANVIIVRDKGFTGSAASVPIYVNSDKVASIYVSESLPLLLPLGEHSLGISTGGHFSEKSERNDLDEQILNVEKGGKYYYRVGVIMGKGLIFQRSTQIE